MTNIKRLTAVAILSLMAAGSAVAQAPSPDAQKLPSTDVKKVIFLVSMEQLVKACNIDITAERVASIAKLRDLYTARSTASGEIQATAIPAYRERIDGLVAKERDKSCGALRGPQLLVMLDTIFATEAALASTEAAPAAASGGPGVSISPAISGAVSAPK